MGDMRSLIALMEGLSDQLANCMRCGMCQAVCPLYAATGREADVARGKLALLDALLQDMFECPDQAAERLQKCLLCGSCEANCPSGVHVTEIFVRARAILTGFMGLSTAQKAVFRVILARPALFDTLVRLGARYQKLLVRPVSELLGTSCTRMGAGLLGGRHFKTLASESFAQQTPTLDKPTGRSGLKIALFVGCLIDKIYPEVARAVVAICDRLGIGLVVPGRQGCCGIPAVSAGDLATFVNLVRHNTALLDRSDFDVLVTACATCTSTIRKIWPMLVPERERVLKQSVDRLAGKTMDISQLLIDLNLTPPPAAPAAGGGWKAVPVTFHDPCHLKKSLNIFAQPRALIKAAGGYDLREMHPADQCCGMGGSFNLKYYGISTQIGLRKRQAILGTEADIVATACPACMLQISDMLSRSGDRVSVRHVAELYAEKMELV